jgi:hypothetical protein
MRSITEKLLLKRMASQGLNTPAALWGSSQRVHKGCQCFVEAMDEDLGCRRGEGQKDVGAPLNAPSQYFMLGMQTTRTGV